MKIKAINPVDAINAKAHRKEKGFYQELSVVAVYKGQFITPITVRFYTTGQLVYCCLWVHDRIHNVYASGSDRAGGYGYHKASTALGEAMRKAGIELSESISGRGQSAMMDAIGALTKKLGFRKYMINNAHA